MSSLSSRSGARKRISAGQNSSRPKKPRTKSQAEILQEALQVMARQQAYQQKLDIQRTKQEEEENERLCELFSNHLQSKSQATASPTAPAAGGSTISALTPEQDQNLEWLEQQLESVIPDEAKFFAEDREVAREVLRVVYTRHGEDSSKPTTMAQLRRLTVAKKKYCGTLDPRHAVLQYVELCCDLKLKTGAS